ncbi:MAG TPA: c-type cytochrome [Acidiferrobacterales bacterium]|nr:c-type cytochrome [Acidiferrobacterales bacterium]
MKSRLFIVITILAVPLLGCSKKEQTPAPKTAPMAFTAASAAMEFQGLIINAANLDPQNFLLKIAALKTAAQESADKPNVAKGQQVYNNVCAACHATGVGGAPKIEDKTDWAPRIKQGDKVLFEHAKNGFTGKKGVMPPKGGNPNIGDADLKNAIAYMKSKAKS